MPHSDVLDSCDPLHYTNPNRQRRLKLYQPEAPARLPSGSQIASDASNYTNPKRQRGSHQAPEAPHTNFTNRNRLLRNRRESQQSQEGLAGASGSYEMIPAVSFR